MSRLWLAANRFAHLKPPLEGPGAGEPTGCEKLLPQFALMVAIARHQRFCGSLRILENPYTLAHFSSLVAVSGTYLAFSCVFPALAFVCRGAALLGAGGGFAGAVGSGASGFAECAGGRAGVAVHGTGYGMGGRGAGGPRGSRDPRRAGRARRAKSAGMGWRLFVRAAQASCAADLPVVHVHAVAGGRAGCNGGAGGVQPGAFGACAGGVCVPFAGGGGAPFARFAGARAAAWRAFSGFLTDFVRLLPVCAAFTCALGRFAGPSMFARLVGDCAAFPPFSLFHKRERQVRPSIPS